jgi:hypothetical protein
MIGRPEGCDIVQLGTRPTANWPAGVLETSPPICLWRGEASADAGATWQVVTEFIARRREA